MSANLFEGALTERTIFKDLTVLSPHYVPEALPHRSEEVKKVVKALAPILRGEKPNNVFVYGKTGTGKTSVIKHVIRHLTEAANAEKSTTDIGIVYMNCRIGFNSKYQVLLKIVEDPYLNRPDHKERPLDGRTQMKLAGMSPTDLYKRLRKTVEANGIGLVIVLDEVDMVKDVDELIYLLTRINDEIEQVEKDGQKKLGRVVIIGITNSFSFKDKLDPRTKSTLCEEDMVFRPYNADELSTILEERIKIGLKSGVIAESNVALIAAYAAQTNGDARYALRLLQKAGEIAQKESRDRIKKEDVIAAKTGVEEDITFELVTTLPEHQQIVLYAIAELLIQGGNYKRLADMPPDILFSGEAYEGYEKACKALNRTPRTMRWFREYLNDLEMLGLVTLSVSGKGVRGNTSIIRLGSPPAEVKRILQHSLGLK
ncbi:ORC1-type DNA replication protein [uncultured archaeon]|nr:ORC1-type DNA replication protein [uncultured archaeon]